MNPIQQNVDGLLDSLDLTLTKVEALVSTTHRTVSDHEASLFLDEAAQLLLVARTLVHEAQKYRTELSRQLANKEEE